MELLSVEDRGRFADFRCGGDVDVASFVRVLTEARERCQALGRKGALVDISGVELTLTGLERFEVATAVAPQWGREICIAIVLRPSQLLPTRMGELAAQNRGVRVRVFIERATAEAWLEAALG